MLNQRMEIDLDDGVKTKAHYAKFQSVVVVQDCKKVIESRVVSIHNEEV